MFVFVVLALAATASRVSADMAFPQSGATLTYAYLTTSKTSQGNITATSTDSYSFQQIGNQWNVTETLAGKITCSTSTAQLSVRFHKISDIMGANSSVSTDPNIDIRVSYVIQDRIVRSTPIGPNAPVGYSAKCTLGGNDFGVINVDTEAVLAGTLRYYVLFYIQTARVTQGSLVPVSLLTATISGTKNVTVLNTSRPALVGTLTGFISGSLYWDRDSGILLLAETTSAVQSDRMLLINSSLPFTATASTTALATTSAASSQATVFTSPTSVVSSVFTTEIQTPLESWPLTTTGLIGLGLVALVAIVVIAIALRRRQSASEKAVERPALKPEPEYRTCRFCGGKIPQGRARCPECGRFW
jgi:hypothetical protein